jgi:hypothetical protein
VADVASVEARLAGAREAAACAAEVRAAVAAVDTDKIILRGGSNQINFDRCRLTLVPGNPVSSVALQATH